MRQIILDTETTGLHVAEGHRIIEFAALEMVDRKLTSKQLHLYINPQRKIDATATKIHGITDADVANKPLFSEVIPQIIEFVKDSQVIIHNAAFDLAFLNAQFMEAKATDSTILPFDSYVTEVIDTLLIARQKFPGARNSLDALCDRFKIDRNMREYHGAVIDCQLLAEIYLTLTRAQINLLQQQEKILTKTQFDKIDTANLNLSIMHASSHENIIHMQYLQTLHHASQGNSLWFHTMQNFESDNVNKQ